jgi:hypothetical protein
MKNYDKYLHVLAGTLIMLVVTYFSNVIIGVAAVLVIAYLKEKWYDANHPLTHTVDGWDAFATACGILLALVLQYAYFKVY